MPALLSPPANLHCFSPVPGICHISVGYHNHAVPNIITITVTVIVTVVNALSKVQQVSLPKMFRLQVMLSESDITPDSDWSRVQGQLSSLAAFAAVKSGEDRHQLFQEYTGDLQVSISHSQ